MAVIRKIAPPGMTLSEQEIRNVLETGLTGRFSRQKILVLIPDHTRSLPLPLLFRLLVEVLPDMRQLNFMVALGTHPALEEKELLRLVGITAEERSNRYAKVGLLNHAWDDPEALDQVHTFEQDQIKLLAGERWHPSLPERINVTINKAVNDHDQIIILGPTFPHEVVGFSGGAKYFFPGISGPEMINATHWLGALSTVLGTIGIKDTPARRMIHAAAEKIKTPITLIALTVNGHDADGIFIGDMFSAWEEAANLSAERHIHRFDKPFQRVLSCAPVMYDELWTAAKAMYKIEPAVAVGGEVVIYAPHLSEVSRVHGKYIYEIGYHILPYFLSDWEKYKHIPLGVLAHSTHMRGSGVMEDGMEKPNVRVILSSRISAEDCRRLNLGYLDPASIHTKDWQDREQEGILYVPKAGEILHRLKS
jgi:nickel-dependent lactate racemase